LYSSEFILTKDRVRLSQSLSGIPQQNLNRNKHLKRMQQQRTGMSDNSIGNRNQIQTTEPWTDSSVFCSLMKANSLLWLGKKFFYDPYLCVYV